MKITVVGLVCLFSLFFLVNGNSIPLKRKPHQFFSHEEMHMRPSRFFDDSIPLGGGILVLGTYVTSLEVGNPPVTVELILDTGSANTGIPIDSCTTCNATGYFTPSESSSFVPMACDSGDCMKCTPDSSSCTECSVFYGEHVCSEDSPSQCGFGITYGGGGSALQGYYGYDTACLGNLCTNATLSLIEREIPSHSMTTAQSTGILGLAYDHNACNPTCVPPFFDSLVSDHLVDDIFSICLTPSDGGVLDLGYVNTSRYNLISNPLQYVPVTFERWYNMELIDIQVGGNSIRLPPFIYSTTNDVIGTFIDSGTSVILMNSMAFNSFKKTFLTHFGYLHGASELFSVSCVPKMGLLIDEYPDVTFVFQSDDPKNPVYLSVPPQSYLIQASEHIYCMGIGSNPGVGVVLGDVFMENYYIVHDRGNKRIGFSPLKEGSCV